MALDLGTRTIARHRRPRHRRRLPGRRPGPDGTHRARGQHRARARRHPRRRGRRRRRAERRAQGLLQGATTCPSSVRLGVVEPADRRCASSTCRRSTTRTSARPPSASRRPRRSPCRSTRPSSTTRSSARRSARGRRPRRASSSRPPASDDRPRRSRPPGRRPEAAGSTSTPSRSCAPCAYRCPRPTTVGRTPTASRAVRLRRSARVYCHLAGITNLAIALGSSCLFTRPLSTGRDEARRASVTAGRGDPPVDRLLHGAARGALGRRGRAARAGSRRDGLVDELAGLLASRSRSPSRSATSTPARAVGEDPYRHTVARRPGARSHALRPVNLLPQRYRSAGPSGGRSGSS